MLGVYQIIPYPELPEIDKQKLNKANDKLSWFSIMVKEPSNVKNLSSPTQNIYMHGATTQKGRHACIPLRGNLSSPNLQH